MNVELIITIIGGLFGLAGVFLKIHSDNKQNKKDALDREVKNQEELSERDKLLSKRLQMLEESFVTIKLLLENLTGDTDFRNELRGVIRDKFSRIVTAPYQFDRGFKNILMSWSEIFEGLTFRFYYSPHRFKNDSEALEEYLKAFIETKISEMQFYVNDQVGDYKFVKRGHQKTRYCFASFLTEYKIYASIDLLVIRLADNHLSDDEVKKTVLKYIKKFTDAFINAVNAWRLLDGLEELQEKN